MPLTCTPHHLTLDALPPGTASVDVRFDGARVWSIDVRDRGAAPLRLDWPEALRPYLSGRARVSVHDSAGGAELAAVEAAFDARDRRAAVADAAGRPLAVNKWGRLGVALEAMGDELRRRIVERSATLVSELRELGLRPFVVGGTLLGAVRQGSLLPHDDDADIAYLSEHTHPVDVAVEAFRIGRALEAKGYEITRHTVAHMQLLFRAGDGPEAGAGSRSGSGEVLHYIDIFSAFFTDDGRINQPFHVRGEMRRDQMLPFGEVEIDGVGFPAPADPDRWLTINYDENWRTPIPGYVLETPVETKRRFENWFGGYQFQAPFWDAFHADAEAEERTGAAAAGEARDRGAAELAWAPGRRWLVERLEGGEAGTAGDVVDLGCGGGALTRVLARAHPGRRVLGLDFSGAALARAERAAGTADARPANLAFGPINLTEMRALTALRALGVTAPFDIVANHLLDQMGHHGRAYAWRVIRTALRSGGSAHVTFHARPAPGVTPDDPTGWHLTPEQLRAEAARYGLALDIEPIRVAAEPHESRAHARARRARRPMGAAVRLAHAGPTDRTETPRSPA